MGLIAKLEQRNADLEKRVAHLEMAFEGLREYAMLLLGQRNPNWIPGDLSSCFICGADHRGLPCPKMAPMCESREGSHD